MKEVVVISNYNSYRCLNAIIIRMLLINELTDAVRPYVIQEVTTPKNIQTLYCYEEKILLIHRGTKKSTHSSDAMDFTALSLSTLSHSPGDLDLTGSPLECPFSMDSEDDLDDLEPHFTKYRKHEWRYLPLTTQQARQMLTKCNMILHNKYPDVTAYSVWAFCDGCDPDRTVLLSSIRNNSYYSRSKATTLDHVPICSVEKTLLKLKTQHLRMASESKAHVEMNATYDILGTRNMPEESVSNAALSLDFVWKKDSPAFEVPPMDAEANLMITVIPGHQESRVLALWDELSALEKLLELYDSDEADMSEINVEQDVISGVRQLLEDADCIKNLSRWVSTSAEDGSLGPLTISTVVADVTTGSRKTYDFTDMLWKELFSTTSNQVLTNALKYVFEQIFRGEARPFIHQRSNTQLGILIQLLIRRETSMPELSHKDTIALVVEIGLEKLRNDFLHVFLGANLVRKEFLGSNMSGTVPRAMWSAQLNWLKKLHIILDILLVVKMHLSLSMCDLQTIVKDVLKSLPNEEVSTVVQNHFYTFKAKVDAKSVMDVLQGKYPQMWKTKLTSKDKLIKTVCILSDSCIFPVSGVNEGMLNSSLATIEYYSIKLLEVGDRL